MPRTPQCTHIKVNGIRCKSPALRGRDLCFFHYRFLERQRQLDEHLPPLEDANAIQFAIMQVIRAVLDDCIELKKANVILYALQVATSNLEKIRFEPYQQKDVVRDLAFTALRKRLAQLVAAERDESSPRSA